MKRQALSNIGVAHIEGMVPKAGGLLAIGPQHGEDPLDNQPDGVEEEPGDQGEDHLEGYFPRCQGLYKNGHYTAHRAVVRSVSSY